PVPRNHRRDPTPVPSAPSHRASHGAPAGNRAFGYGHLLRRGLRQSGHVQPDVSGRSRRIAFELSDAVHRRWGSAAGAGLLGDGLAAPRWLKQQLWRSDPHRGHLASPPCSSESLTPSFMSSIRTRRWTSMSASWGWWYTPMPIWASCAGSG